MERRVLIVERDGRWGIYDALKGDPIVKSLPTLKESLDLCEVRHFVPPPIDREGRFLTDLEGEPLYRGETEGTLEYADGLPCLDFSTCPACGGPAFGREAGKENCYYCPSCDRDVACVPPPEWIGAVD